MWLGWLSCEYTVLGEGFSFTMDCTSNTNDWLNSTPGAGLCNFPSEQICIGGYTWLFFGIAAIVFESIVLLAVICRSQKGCCMFIAKLFATICGALVVVLYGGLVINEFAQSDPDTFKNAVGFSYIMFVIAVGVQIVGTLSLCCTCKSYHQDDGYSRM